MQRRDALSFKEVLYAFNIDGSWDCIFHLFWFYTTFFEPIFSYYLLQSLAFYCMKSYPNRTRADVHVCSFSCLLSQAISSPFLLVITRPLINSGNMFRGSMVAYLRFSSPIQCFWIFEFRHSCQHTVGLTIMGEYRY